MDFENQREEDYRWDANRYGGYAAKNSGGGNYKGGKGSNAGRPRGSKAGNQRGAGGGKSSFAAPEMVKAVYLTAAIPVIAVLTVAGYFGYAWIGS